MSTGTRHTLSAFDDDMDQIRGLISEMGARAEAAVTNAMQALLHHDLDLATQTRADDKIIDRLEEDVEKQVVQTIALRAPMADDLRELIAALKIAAVIERIADYAKNISKRVLKLAKMTYLPVIKWSIDHKRTVLSLSAASLVFSGALLMNMGGEFVPQLDEGDFVIQPALKTGTSLSKTVELTTQMEKILKKLLRKLELLVLH